MPFAVWRETMPRGTVTARRVRGENHTLCFAPCRSRVQPARSSRWRRSRSKLWAMPPHAAARTSRSALTIRGRVARAAASLCRVSKGRSAAASAVRVLLRAGVRLGYVTANAAAKPGIGLHRQREPVIWSPDQAAHMAAAADAMGWRSIGTAILLNGCWTCRALFCNRRPRSWWAHKDSNLGPAD